LQVIEDGQLTDSFGRRVDFKNTVLIMTSNVGARQMKTGPVSDSAATTPRATRISRAR
jgi:ATP-dependent Clp protease ATP-binding subunit ClpC